MLTVMIDATGSLRRWFIWSAFAALTAVAPPAGCSWLRAQPTEPYRGFSKEEVSASLNAFENYFETQVRQAAEEIDRRSQDRKLYRRTLLWRLRCPRMCREMLAQDNPVRAFVDVWTLCVRMRQFFETGTGHETFGDYHVIALEAARRCEAEIEQVGSRFVPRQTLTDARRRVEVRAEREPLRSDFSGVTARDTPPPPEAEDPLQQILALPLAPFRAIGGIDRGAEAIKGFTAVAARFTDVVQALPEEIQWQLQLLLLDAEQNPAVLSSLDSFRRVAESLSLLSATAEALPARLRQETVRLLDDAEDKQAAASALLSQMQQTAAALDSAARGVAEAGAAWEGAADSITRMVDGFRSPADHAPTADSAPAAQPRRPFDILDYAHTADALTRSAVELRALAADVRGVADSAELAGRIADARTEVRGLIAFAFWRLAALAGIVFALALAYRWIIPRPAPRRGTHPA